MRLNCDLGENEESWQKGVDKKLLTLVQMVNISCGQHAGNPQLIKETISLARIHDKQIGAHPSYPDRENFGRKSLNINKQDLFKSIHSQLLVFVNWTNGTIDYVKPHGALYHDCMRKPEVLATLLRAMKELDLQVPIMLMAGFKCNSPLISEAFLDRQYLNSQELIPRSSSHSLITNPKRALEQYIQITENERVIGEDGKVYGITAESLCIHSDTPNVLRIVEEIVKYKENKAD